MADLSDYLSCCGMRDLGGIQFLPTPKEVLKSFVNEARADTSDLGYGGGYDWTTGHSNETSLLDSRFRFVTFSVSWGQDYRNPGIGDALAKYIKAKRLGTVVATPRAINPNTGNRVKVWVWTVNWKALNKWAREVK